MCSVDVALVLLVFFVFVIDAYAVYFVAVVVFTGDAVYAEAAAGDDLHFGSEFFYGFLHGLVHGCAVLEGPVEEGCPFVAGHGAVAMEVAVGVAFEVAVTGEGGYVFVGPVVFRYVREVLCLVRIEAVDFGSLAELFGGLFPPDAVV